MNDLVSDFGKRTGFFKGGVPEFVVRVSEALF